MNKGIAIVCMIVAFIGGYFVGNLTSRPRGVAESGPKLEPGVVAAAAGETERFKVPLGSSPVKGPRAAKVTIVEFSDFECPFCSRGAKTMKELEQNYPGTVRLVFKHNPLPFHQNAKPAAMAAIAAGEQGKFWEMHDKLFENAKALGQADLERYAQVLGLDLQRFKTDMAAERAKSQIEQDQKLAEQLGARGTPAFFINGRFVSGAQPYDNFKKIVDEEIGVAEKLLKQGATPDGLYAEVTRNGKTQAGGPGGEGAKPTPPTPSADANQVYKVPVGESPVKGPQVAKVTIVEFSDFECPFCSRGAKTMADVEKEYGKSVRIVFKNNPLPFHQNAQGAAEAALAAGEQGKFWEMHDKLFENAKALGRQELEKYAEELGLNMGRFKAALDSGKFKQAIAADQALAAKIGARGTPTFFINGRALRGAMPLPSFKAVIDEEIKKADAAIGRGVSMGALYDELTKNGLAAAAAAPPPTPPRAQPGQPDANEVYAVPLGNAPLRGAKNAKVTIVEFSEFQCPFCSRGAKTVEEVLKNYDSVRVAFRNLPLPFHQNAKPAAVAALAAGKQGKFWEMHDKLFANQQSLTTENFEKWADEIGINAKRFKADIESEALKEQVAQDEAVAAKFGARGTPTFFINGRVLVGAQPLDAFKAKIDEEIKKADALLAKGVKPARLYDELTRNGKTEVAGPSPSAGAGGSPKDEGVFKVEAGSAPSKGPRNAKVTIVEFSDFQCPFCSRVVPTIKQILAAYPGRVRVAFKNFPLSFHQHAQLAAEASLAAHAQGKFWEMHDKMFENARALERENLEKYAGEIGLNVDRFKADLDSGRYKAAVNADVAQGNAIGDMGTPTFFINGRKVAGALPFESFKAIIDEELKK